MLHLDGVRYELGDLRPIEEAPGLDPAKAASFREQGLDRYSVLDQEEFDEALVAAVEGTLSRTESHPKDIDAVLISTSTLWAESNDLYRGLIHNVGLVNAYPYGVAMSECANALATLQVAAGLAALGRIEKALVVLIDRIDETRRSRVVSPDASIYSDAVVTFLLDVAPRGYAIGDINTVSNNAMWSMTPSTPAYLKAVIDGLRRAWNEALERSSSTIEDLDRVLPNNYSNTFIDLFRMATGCPVERLFTENIARHAHSYAGDGFINLACLEEAGESLEHVLLLTAGIGTWGTAILRKVP